VAGRRPEMEDWLNSRIYHPLSNRVAAALKPTAVTPNMVSAVSGLMIVLAGIFYVGLEWPLSVLLGFLAHALWHVFDGADGELARMTGRASPLGEVVDGACDYGGHFILYNIIGIALLLETSIGHWIWPIGYAAGLSRIVQANHVESQRRTYLWRVYGVPWLKQAPAEPRGAFGRLIGPVARAYVALAAAVNPMSKQVDEALERASAHPETKAKAIALCRSSYLRMRSLEVLLGPNHRTTALGICMAAGAPLWYFIYEAAFLNLVLLVSIARQRRENAMLAGVLEVELETPTQRLTPAT
jgi:hypothetical protein